MDPYSASSLQWIIHKVTWANAQGHQPFTTTRGAPHDTSFKNILKFLKDHT